MKQYKPVMDKTGRVVKFVALTNEEQQAAQEEDYRRRYGIWWVK